MLFVSFTKGPGGFPYVFIIAGEVPTLIPIDGITLGDHGVFVLRGDQDMVHIWDRVLINTPGLKLNK